MRSSLIVGDRSFARAAAHLLAVHPHGFWDRNFDALMVGIVVTAIGGVAAAAILALRTDLMRRARGEGSRRLVDIRPVQGPGENIWKKIRREDSRLITEPEWFQVRLHVKLWARDNIELINAALAYDWEPGTSPERQEALIDGADMQFDASDRFTKRVPVSAGKISDIIIRREFVTARVMTNDTDYRRAMLSCELSTPAGLRNVTFTAKLEPGGQLSGTQVKLDGGGWLSRASALPHGAARLARLGSALDRRHGRATRGM